MAKQDAGLDHHSGAGVRRKRMHLDHPFATPACFVPVALDLPVARLRGRRAYRADDAISSIGPGGISQVVGMSGCRQ